MKLSDFLNDLADKVGNKNDQGLIDFLSRSDIVNIDVPDGFCNSVTSGTMSLEGAKNNAILKSHFSAQALNLIDSIIANAVSDFNVDFSDFEAEKSTPKKLKALNAKIKELMEKKPDNTDEYKKKYDDMRKEYAELNKKMADTLDGHKKEVSAVREESNMHVLNFLKSNHLKGLQYADKERSLDVNMDLAQLLIDRAMVQKSAKVVNDNGALKLVQTNDTEMAFLDESHKPVKYEDFVKKVLADNKVLSVSDPSKGNPVPPNPTFPQYQVPSYQQPPQYNVDRSRFDAAMAGALADVQS